MIKVTNKGVTTDKINEPTDEAAFGFVTEDKFTKRKKPVDEMKRQEKAILKSFVDNQRVTMEGKSPVFKHSKEVFESGNKIYQDFSQRYGSEIVVEMADNAFRVRKKLGNGPESVYEFADLASGGNKDGKYIIETADDDRVIGIPYTIANLGADKYYVINGRMYSGWSMWYGLNAIRSPEDYARNVDLTYNVPFIWSGFLLKANLSLGASFDIVQGSEDEETPEEAFVKEIFFNKLQINVNKLMKTSMHLDMYGNAYWHLRRDGNGFPDKITILQPERIKVFLDPKTTKVLYYIYLPPILAGMALTPYPNIRENPNVMWGPALTYPTPIVIDPADIIHFKENDFTEYPFGLSSCKALIDPATARMDINVIAPMIFKKYAKPMIHWRMDPMVPFQLTKGQIENYIDGFKTMIETLEPMSDPVTSSRWQASVIGAAQGKAELLTILQDLDNQIFASIGVPESYFKPQFGQDRMLAEQDKTLIAAMQQRQQMVGENIFQKIIRPCMARYDQILNEQMVEMGQEPMPPRQWNQFPTAQWRETFKQDQVSTIQNTLALLQSGIIDHARAARRVGEVPPQESNELSRMQDLQKIQEEVQIKTAELQFMQTQLQMMQTQAIINNGGVDPFQPPDQGGGGSGGSGEGGSSSGKDIAQHKVDTQQDNQKFRVTFTNKKGKKQTEIMKGSTLQDIKSAGTAVQNIEAADSSSPEIVIVQDNTPPIVELTPEEIKTKQVNDELAFEMKTRELALLKKKEELLNDIRSGIKQ